AGPTRFESGATPTFSTLPTLRSSISVHPFEQPFTVAKVTDAKYAEMLLDGDVYARPLNAFGGWDRLANIQNDPSVNNSF
ncbi:hypothetical protein, partial [Collinsella sp. TF08-11AT]|uniref:hypothetical protein n=1 Tax=Collinsella sp. TF08-11AT TaxID=2292333 RepID=UPI001F2ABA6B